MYQKNADEIITKKYKARKFLYYILILAPTTLVAGLRYGIGVDYHSYVLMYNEVNIHEIFSSREPLYSILQYLVKIIFQDKTWGLFLVTSFLTLYFILKGAEYFRKDLSISFALFIYYLTYYIEGFNIVRQMLALAIIFFGLRYLIDRNLLKYAITIAVATLIHNSAIIALIFYFIPFKTTKRTLLWNVYFYGILILIPLLINQIINVLSKLPILNLYFARLDLMSINVDSRLILETVIVFLPALLFRSVVVSKNPKYQLLLNIGLATLPLRYLLFSLDYAWRINYYLTSVQILLIPIIIKSFKNKYYKFIFTVIFTLMYILYFIYFYIIRGMGPGIPYRSVIPYM